MTRAKALAPWTDGHRREAEARCCELAAEAIRSGNDALGRLLSEMGAPTLRSFEIGLERAFVPGAEVADIMRRRRLSSVQLAEVETLSRRVDREVRRVRALAEGRLVRETSERWYVRRGDGHPSGYVPDSMADAAEWASRRNAAMGPEALRRIGAYVAIRVRVTRLRRA